MQYKTKELNIISHPNNILEISSSEESQGRFTLEEVENNLAMIKKAADNRNVATLVHVSSTYVPKAVLKKYSDLDYVIFTGLIVNSYASKLIGNLFLSIILRLNSRQVPTKLFTDKKTAIEWLTEQLKKQE